MALLGYQSVPCFAVKATCGCDTQGTVAWPFSENDVKIYCCWGKKVKKEGHAT